MGDRPSLCRNRLGIMDTGGAIAGCPPVSEGPPGVRSDLRAAIDAERCEKVFVEFEPDSVAGVDVGAVHPVVLPTSCSAQRLIAFATTPDPVEHAGISMNSSSRTRTRSHGW